MNSADKCPLLTGWCSRYIKAAPVTPEGPIWRQNFQGVRAGPSYRLYRRWAPFVKPYRRWSMQFCSQWSCGLSCSNLSIFRPDRWYRRYWLATIFSFQNIHTVIAAIRCLLARLCSKAESLKVIPSVATLRSCLLYTSDAADE